MCLSIELCSQAPEEKEIVIARGFTEELEVRSSKETSDLHAQRSTHVADTRMVLYAVHGQFRTVVVSYQDSDVLLLLVAHFERAQCEHLWMMSGTSKKRRFIYIYISQCCL